MRKLLAAAIAAGSIATATPTYADIKAEVEAIKAQFQTRIDALKQQADALDDDLPSDEQIAATIYVETDWELQEFKLDIPEFVMNLQRWVLHLPQSHMRTQRWVFHLPEVYWGTTSGPFGIGKLDLPQVRMKRNEVKLDIPEFTFSPVEIKLHIPEVAMRTQTWKMHLPTFIMRDANVEVDRIKTEGQEIGARMKTLSTEMSGMINAKVRAHLVAKRNEVAAKFDEGINGLQATVNAWAGNPKVDTASMTTSLNQLKAQRAKALAKLDQEIAKLS